MTHHAGFYESYIKRLLDILISGLGLLLLSPLLGITAILVRVKLGSPVIFRQERPGKDEKIFRLYKFRSMTDQRDEAGALLPDEQRLTRFGRLLRSTSLDELPELYNIFRGDMSLVGPRPLLVSYLPWYTEAERHRHDVRPGLTGLAQVSGRNNLAWEEKFRYDLKYIHSISFRADLKILFLTVKKVLHHADVISGDALKQVAGRLDEERKQSAAVTLRPFSHEDVPLKVRWINDPQTNTYLHYDLPLEEAATHQWLDRVRQSPDRCDLTVCFGGVPVGIIGLIHMDPHSAELYITLGEARGQGLAGQAMEQLCRKGFAEYGLAEIYLYTETRNTAAIRAYEKFGMTRTERRKQDAVNRDGEPVDRFRYCISRNEFEGLYGTISAHPHPQA